MRGKVPRIQINRVARHKVFTENSKSEKKNGEMDVEKMAVVNILIARILVYSAMKISAKGPLLYSVLNPDTSSDSPSARSKGVRLVSANIVIYQMKAIGRIIKSAHEKLECVMDIKLKVCGINSADSRIKAMLTS